jgi:hypothetical protein
MPTYTDTSINQIASLQMHGWPRFGAAELTEWWNGEAEDSASDTTGPWGASEGLRQQGMRAVERWREFYESWNPRGETLTVDERERWKQAVRQLALALDTTERAPTTWELTKKVAEETYQRYTRQGKSLGKWALGLGVVGGGLFLGYRIFRK